jgi:hypothetical protein
MCSTGVTTHTPPRARQQVAAWERARTVIGKCLPHPDTHTCALASSWRRSHSTTSPLYVPPASSACDTHTTHTTRNAARAPESSLFAGLGVDASGQQHDTESWLISAACVCARHRRRLWRAHRLVRVEGAAHDAAVHVDEAVGPGQTARVTAAAASTGGGGAAAAAAVCQPCEVPCGDGAGEAAEPGDVVPVRAGSQGSRGGGGGPR